MTNLTYDKSRFYMNGKPFLILSGTIHYFRVPREYWYDRLLKLKECGFNTVETYTCWNLHEPREGEFCFSDGLDIEAFLEIARELGLYVILRPGPYICAEWEFGGLPAWILSYEDMPLRCYDEVFLSKVRRYYNELLGRVRPYLASNGGNIIMLQVENEYGSYGDDKDYLRAIAEIYRENQMDCTYFTSDGTCYSMMNGGMLDEYLAVANFGADPKLRFPALKEYRPNQPLMCGEFWCGWFDHWFEQHHEKDPQEVISAVRSFLDMGASLNLYMFHGGTNFGFTNGSNHDKTLEPTVTSYDYCAPLSEAGDRTPLYYGLRALFEEYFGKLPPMTATDSKKAAYGRVYLTEQADLLDNLDRISKPIHTAAPKSMEQVGQNFGYILYRSQVKGPREERPILFNEVHDRAQIFVDGKFRKTYERWAPLSNEDAAKLSLGYGESAQLDILVENMGRVNYGPMMKDRKGVSGIRFGNFYHFGWDMYPLPMEDLSGLRFEVTDQKPSVRPTFLRGRLHVEGEPADSFVRLDGFKKGFVMINGHNLGRYFNEAGPQKTLYVPAPFLHSGDNEVIVFESDSTDRLFIEFFDQPDLG
ncbi:MAG: beta-galactosidase [Ruminococcaceae bacterium]|nr:beta-galactosidase [Oscillospiraceae bacterium]